MSFSIHDNTTESSLSAAILLYGKGNNHTFATVHDIFLDDAQRPVIGAGRPMDAKALKTIASDLLSSLQVRCGLLPSNALSVGSNHIMWWSAPSRRTYFFNTGENEDAVCVGNRCGEAVTPGLVFLVRDSSMWVFAVKGNKRPEASTPLFHAPLMNIYADGRLCHGSMAQPQSTLAESIDEWESAFWRSSFSHPNQPKAVKYRGGLHAFSIALLDGKFKTFPERVLVPAKETLADVLNNLDQPPTGQGRGRG